MKTLGIIGGLGPESTVDYYQRIIALHRERMRDGHYPEFVIVSVDLRKGLDFMEAGDLSGMADFLLEGIGKLARASAEFGIISANTPHIVFDDVAAKVADSTDQHCRSDMRNCQNAEAETARPIWNALHHAGRFLSKSFFP